MKPSWKSDDINQVIEKMFDVNRVQSIQSNHCIKSPIGCGKEIKLGEFVDDISLKEYKISGLCAECQHKIFG